MIARTVKSMFRAMGMNLTRYKPVTPEDQLLSALDSFVVLRQIASAGGNEEELAFVNYCARNWNTSKSQLFQDLFVLFQLNEKRGGYFVEFGAADGVHLSNSFSLEKNFGWHGVLSEPARVWHQALHTNRGCRLELRCVWDSSDHRLVFSEADASELSTIKEFASSDLHAQTRRHAKEYEVATITLSDMLAESGAPQEIDYLSIDTEGSELRILSAFDFKKYNIKIITVEHNYTPQRQGLNELLLRNGYTRKFQGLSRFDDWYVRA